jgi:hypothetical protein
MNATWHHGWLANTQPGPYQITIKQIWGKAKRFSGSQSPADLVLLPIVWCLVMSNVYRSPPSRGLELSLWNKLVESRFGQVPGWTPCLNKISNTSTRLVWIWKKHFIPLRADKLESRYLPNTGKNKRELPRMCKSNNLPRAAYIQNSIGAVLKSRNRPLVVIRVV